MQTALHIMALVAELETEVVGGTITATEFYKKQRAAYFFIKKDNSRQAFGFVYHPAASGTFVVPASKIKIDSREKPRPVFKLEGAMVKQVEQVGFDRIFQLFLDKGNESLSIVVEALGPNGNIWLLGSQQDKLASLRKRTFTRGDCYQTPLLPDKANPRELSVTLLEDRLKKENRPTHSCAEFIEKNILGFDHPLARELDARSGVGDLDLLSPKEADLESLVKSVSDVVTYFEHPKAGFLYHVANKLEAYPFKLAALGQPTKKYKSLSLAVLAMIDARHTQVQTAGEMQRIKGAVERALKRLERRRQKIEQDLRDASGYEQYQRIGELLQINFNKIKKGMTEITVDDIYAEVPIERTITLNPALSPAENVEVYFKQYRKERHRLELSRRRLAITKEELTHLSMIQSQLEKDFETARSRYDQEITRLVPQESARRRIQTRLPFREYTLSTGLTILVGRGGADNDRTTFEFAKPYELWFHTQQCPGSHVVMKFPNKSFEPSKSEIEETAAVAAYFSKARSDSLAPVIYTQRRYVRKPRKAKWGLVTVNMEKSVMVSPRKPSRPN